MTKFENDESGPSNSRNLGNTAQAVAAGMVAEFPEQALESKIELLLHPGVPH
jgi:hypothetical protein